MKALQIDPGLAEAFPSLASARFKYDWDWAGAERDFKHGIELNPNCATARHWYGHYLWCTGRFDEAVKQTQQALQLDPLDFLDQRPRIEHDPIADHRQLAGAHDPRGQQR